MKMTTTTLRAALLLAFALAPLACSDESNGLPMNDAGGAGGSAGAGGAGGSDAAAPDLPPDLAPDLPPDLPPDLAPDLPPPVPCKPVATGKAAVCGRIYRSATLPLLPADARADGKGGLLVIPFACNPLAPKGDPDACAMEGPPAIGTGITLPMADLSKADSEIMYEITDLTPGPVFLVTILLEEVHDLKEGFKAGDTLVTPTPKLMLAAGEAVERPLKLSAMAREIKVAVSADAALMPPGDKKGPLVVLGYEMPPGMGVQPIAVGALPDTKLPVTVSVVVLQAKTFYLIGFLDDDNSSMNLMKTDDILSTGDLARTGAIAVTIGPDDVEKAATLTLDELWM